MRVSCTSQLTFIATAEALDREMRARIDEHRRTRDASFHTVEEPTDLAVALKAVPPGVEVAVIDCITVWLGNLFYHQRVKDGSAPEIEAFLASLKAPPCDLIVVTNSNFFTLHTNPIKENSHA